jgi:hypothetical protein
VSETAIRLALTRLQAEVWRSPKRFKVLVAARRAGKTRYAITKLIKSGLAHDNHRYWYVAPTRLMAKDIVWSELKMSLDPSWVRRISETELLIELVTGSTLQLFGAEEYNNLRGRSLNGVILDEYADMKPEVWFEVLRPALADKKGWADFLGTPKSFNHFYDLYRLGQSGDPDWQSWQFRTIDNPFIDPAEIEAARKGTDPRTFRQEYEASFESVTGRAYYAFSREAHIGPVELAQGVPACVSFDFNVQPATCVVGQRFRDECRVWREVFLTHRGGEATRASALAAKAHLEQAGWRGPVRIYGDATGKSAKTTGPSDHAVLREVFPHATWCIPSENPHVRDRVAAVNGRCETMDGASHLRVDPSCVKVIGDLEQVTFADNGDLDQKTNPLLTHISDALGYWIAWEWPPAKRGGVAVANHWWVG